MLLEKLSIHRVRNLQSVILDELSLVNVIAGPNGSGKTSILEAIHLLALARSFRTHRAKKLIQHDKADCLVHAAGESAAGYKLSVGVSRPLMGSPTIRLNGENVTALAELAEHLPLQLLYNASFELIEGGPAIRRQFLDWGVFHVEHDYLSCWQSAKKCIKHRNTLLRRGKMHLDELIAWDGQLGALGEELHKSRTHYMSKLNHAFHAICSRMLGRPLELGYARGWKSDSLLFDLEQSRERDFERGFTSVGPHRADLVFTDQGRLAVDTLSRGQIKIAVAALRVAQAAVLKDEQDKRCLFLVDDLSAELDGQHRQRLAEELSAVAAQVFVTSIDADAVIGLWGDTASVRMFHVEHGLVERRQCST